MWPCLHTKSFEGSPKYHERERVNWNGTITISQGWRYTTIILHIRDMLLEYIFFYFEPTHSVYEFGIFHVWTYLTPLSLFLSCMSPCSITSRRAAAGVDLGVPTAAAEIGAEEALLCSDPRCGSGYFQINSVCG